MNPLLTLLQKDTKYIKILNKIQDDKTNTIKKNNVSVIGMSTSQKAYYIASMYNSNNMPILIVCSNALQARKLIQDINFYIQDEVLFFPARNVIYYDIEAQSREISNQRLNVISKIQDKTAKIIVTTVDALLQKLTPFEKLNKNIYIDINMQIQLDKLTNTLVSMGYSHSDIVDGKGQFTLRGGIIDIFPIDSENPVRIELFGDDIDSIRTFDINSQRSIENIQKINITSANESYIPNEDILNAINVLEKLMQSNINEDLKAQIDNDIQRLKTNDIEQSLIDKYFNLLVKKYETFLDYFDNKNCLIYIDEPVRCIEKSQNVIYENNETIKMLAQRNYLYMDYVNTYIELEKINLKLNTFSNIFLEKLNLNDDINIKRQVYEFAFNEQNYVKGAMDILMQNINIWQKSNNYILLVYPSQSRADLIKNQLIDNNFKNVEYIDNIFNLKKLEKGHIYVSFGILSSGFEYNDIDLKVVAQPVSGTDLNAKQKLNKKSKSENENIQDKISSFDELNEGEYIVHENHGIGIYRGIHTVSVGDIKNDYIKIEYADSAILYVPIAQLDSVRRYVGDEDVKPKLNILGSKQWHKTKSKAKAYVESIAKDLVLLYAKRQQSRGFAFSPDSPWQKEFEDTFKYELTYDQQKALDEIKHDMQQPIPMDRLLCGDVGYGKTEVAIRVAFKAVVDQKQVAYLVPTTVLCMQQYETFKQRMESFGINVEMLSRFRTKKQQTQILKDLASGRIDVIIGTHRILSKDVKYKDLGLLIIDEEHRFGVKAKETIKKMKEAIDVLSMTATPIPRTLHMSMIGVRQMSTLFMPPLERIPVHTYVLEYDEQVIKQAIEKELERDGQVFYINNRVENIEAISMKIQRLVPEARIAFAHGQMEPRQIEDIMLKFVEHKLDIIVCTTILESGIDIPNANTIIIENADKMGLAQLYQIRGRVGRSNKVAYAYITYQKNKQISEVAEKRLKALKDFTEFGSGFKIALKDLEIRGSGNLFGHMQHGHMVSIGYDMYLKMLEDAISKQKQKIANNDSSIENNTDDDYKEVKIDINVSAYINNKYINDLGQKIQAYQKISNIHTDEDATQVLEELTDRYGDVPVETQNLIKIMQIRNIAKKLKIEKIIQYQNYIIFKPNNLKIQLTNINNNDILDFIKITLINLEKMLVREKGN